MKNKLTSLCLLCAALAFFPGHASAAEQAKVDRAQLEKEFSQKLSGATLVGRFSVEGEDSTLKPERYELESVSKLQGDYWLFLARIQYGEHDVKLPITLRVVWAEETPMITLTNLAIPGLGSEFSARVLFHGNRYAGTWQHGKVGGHMWGLIEKAEAKPAPKADNAPKATKDKGK